jgi:hypothetical protein
LRTEMINSIGDTYIRMVIWDGRNPGVYNSSSGEIDCCIKGGKGIGRALVRCWESMEGWPYRNTFLPLAIDSYCSFDSCWEAFRREVALARGMNE